MDGVVSGRQKLLLLADEMRAMSVRGKHFAENVYERERAVRLLELSAELASLAADEPLDEVADVFRSQSWHRASPAMAAEAAVFNPAGEILLIRRRDNNLWALPAGLVEVGQTPAEAAIKELWEEAGVRGTAVRLLGIFDGRLWDAPSRVHMLRLVFLVDSPELTPVPGVEAVEARFFARTAIPTDLHPGHEALIPEIFELAGGSGVYFDPATSVDEDMPSYQRPGQEQNGTR
jgi:8-oxo-dGTP pyrophosphatase MutT (NUDIX family)